MRTRITRVVGGVAAATAAGLTFTALPAHAATTATATVVEPGSVRFDAAAGQTNNLLITAQGRVVTFDDDVAVTAGAGCAQVSGDDTRVTCDLGAPALALGLVVNVRDGADTVVNDSAIGLLAAGGAGADLLIGSDAAVDQLRGEGGADETAGRGGDDTVSGGPGNDRLFGGPGDDLLDGAAGVDFFYGDEGDDLLRGGAGNDDMIGGMGADVVDGGPGRDQVSYSERSVGVVADLDDARGDDGEPGEGDSLLRVEDIVGTTQNDVLTGNNSDNSLFGSSGGDLLSGLGGNDYLEGGVTEFDGADSLDGGDDRGNPGDICRTTPNGGSIAVNCEAFLEN